METIALAEVAAVLADPSRATMCQALLDGRAWTVGELGKAAGIALSTASEHLAQHAEHRPVNGLKSSVRVKRLGFARTCYDHLAGVVGVAVRNGMLAEG